MILIFDNLNSCMQKWLSQFCPNDVWSTRTSCLCDPTSTQLKMISPLISRSNIKSCSFVPSAQYLITKTSCENQHCFKNCAPLSSLLSTINRSYPATWFLLFLKLPFHNLCQRNHLLLIKVFFICLPSRIVSCFDRA